MNRVFPHEGTCVRIGVSKIHGIGVIAICDIPKGTNIFKGDSVDVIWVSKNELGTQNLQSAHMKLYTDFCILKDGMYGCPPSFNSLTPGWYINEPTVGSSANVKVNDKYDFFAVEDICKGDELTVEYSTFSEHINRY